MSTQAFLFAAFAAILFSVFGLLSRVLSVKSENPLALSAVYGFIGAIFSIPILFVEPWKFGDITLGILFVTFLATVLFGIFEATEFFAQKYLEASRSTIFFQITPIVTFIGSVAFLHESVSLQKLFAIALIIGGNGVVAFRHGGHISMRGALFMLGAVFGLGSAYVADKAVFSHYPLGLYVGITYLFPALYVSALIRGQRFLQLKRELLLASWRLPILGAVSVLSYYMVLKTFQLAEASVAIPVIFTSTILTALGGVVILKERSNIAQKLLGAVFVVFGVSLLR